jgi:hypothetical protein
VRFFSVHINLQLSILSLSNEILNKNNVLCVWPMWCILTLSAKMWRREFAGSFKAPTNNNNLKKSMVSITLDAILFLLCCHFFVFGVCGVKTES